jgi:hypothetical protein
MSNGPPSPPLRDSLLITDRFLVDDEVYDITNGWRSRRGEPILARPDVGMGPALTQDTWGYQNDPHARGS